MASDDDKNFAAAFPWALLGGVATVVVMLAAVWWH
jgi:hypothetical protein